MRKRPWTAIRSNPAKSNNYSRLIVPWFLVMNSVYISYISTINTTVDNADAVLLCVTCEQV